MSDWLDSDEFESLVDDVVAAECSYDSFEALQAKIREHFEPKRKWIKITDNPKTWPPLGVRVLLSNPPSSPSSTEWWRSAVAPIFTWPAFLAFRSGARAPCSTS